MNDVFTWAKRYLELGLRPFPIAFRSKVPIKDFPLKRYQTQAPTVGDLAQWFCGERRNIGLLMGRGTMAVDLDGPGAEEALLSVGVDIPQFAPRSKTANGYHALLACPPDIGDSTALLKSKEMKPDGKGGEKPVWQVDIRGVGYIVAPPSVHKDTGSLYEWQVQPCELGELPTAPQKLIDLIHAFHAISRTPAGGPGSPAGSRAAAAPADAPTWLTVALAGVSEGSRDDTCTRLAGYFLGRGMPADVVRATLVLWAGRCRPPFPDDQVDKCLRSVQARDAVHGRHETRSSQVPAGAPDPSDPPTPPAARAAYGGIPAPFQVLGYNQGCYYYLPIGARQVVELRAKEHTPLNLYALAPLQYWERAYPGDAKPHFDWAANRLMRQAEEAGVYDADRIRGRGAWWDDETDSAVLHLGDRIVRSAGGQSQVIPIQDVRPGRYIYEAGAAMDVRPGTPLCADHARRLVELLEGVSWEKPINSRLLAGWIALAPVCGALRWRPHLWVTGSACSGKTWVVNEVARSIIGDISLRASSNTSEAGIRQTLRSDARPVLFDEIEGENQQAQQQIQNVLSLARQSSSDTDARILKGTTGGTAQAYRIRSSFLFSSIGVMLQQHADVSRVTVLTINKDLDEGHEDRFKRLVALRNEVVTREFVDGLHARVIRMIPVIRQNAETFASAGSVQLGSRRMGDQLGALLGAAYALYSDEPITPDAAAAWLAKQDWTEHKADHDAPDEQRCLSRILEHVVRVPAHPAAVDRTLAELISLALHRTQDDNGISGSDAEATLNRYGIRTLDGECRFIVAVSHGALERILAGTPWSRGWARLLRRISGSVASDQPYRFAGVRSRGVVLEWHDDKSDTNFPFGDNADEKPCRAENRAAFRATDSETLI
ncbi:MAG: bifunctional DNA primase/polymerase [Elusimicrobia bacterium]|nr:bifunctional DNA primase/polymerase [Elusimicrobiota bacterium]